MTRLRITLLAAVLAITLPAFAQQPANPASVTAKPRRIVLFKNGLGLIDSTVSLPAPAGKYQITPLPDATLGMFWVTDANGIQLTDIRATQTMAPGRSAMTIPEFIEANIGKSAQLRINNEWRPVLLKELPQSTDIPNPVNRYDTFGNPIELSSIPIPTKAQFVVVEENGNTAAVALTQIQEVRIVGPADLKLSRPVKTLAFTSAPNGQAALSRDNIKLTYLSQNITWAPSYRVELVDDKKATLYAKAIIVNDLTPLDDVQAELVTGYPNLEFASVPDFFSLIPLRSVLTAIQNQGTQRDAYSSNMLRQASTYDYDGRQRQDSSAMPPGPLTGESSEDLYFYPVKNVTLAKGERGYFEVFTAPVEYEHVYTWDVPDYIAENDPYRSSSQNNDKTPPQAVWHALKLTNKSAMPWTTGPGATTKSGRILGQSMLNYTPINGTTELKITQVSAVNAEQAESETDRKRNAANFYGYNYDQVTVKGDLQLINYTSKPLTIKITKTLSGEVQKTDNNPTITKLARGLKSVNPKSQLTWTVTVEPGKDKATCVKYTYQLYVRN